MPSIIPAHATQVGKVSTRSMLMITYRAGKTYFRVRFGANGHYTVSKADAPQGGSPDVRGGSLALPRGMDSPWRGKPAKQPAGPPFVPFLLIGALFAACAGVRRAATTLRRY